MDAAKVGFKEKLGYGLGDLASGFIWTAASAFLTFFYTDVVGLSAAAVGTLLLVARVFDGFVDIGVGALIDRTKSRHGKARPWLLWLAVPFGIAGVLMFTAPDLGPTGALVYAYITYLIMNVIYSGINVPYGVLNSLITQDAYQRSVLNIFRMVMALVGAVLVTSLTMPLVAALGGGKTGWMSTFLIFGALSILLFLITFKTTTERVKPSVTQKDIPLKRGVKALFRNKYWALMVGFGIVFFTLNAAGSAVNVYYAQYVLKDASLVGILNIAGLVPILIGLFLVAPIIKKYGKRNAAFGGIIVMILGSLVMLIDPASLSVILTATVIKAIGTVPIMGTFFAMLADTVEYGEWKTGMRTEGLVYSAGSFGTKAGSGIGAALTGWILAWGGYVGGQEVQSDTTIAALQFLFIYLPVILCAVGLVILWFYKLDQKYQQIIDDLNAIKTMS
ncbi:MFS transporter [Paenibacillus mucilaginosus]|uniref:Sugar (Glycoside-Pentoside-hexuronide) transporter n=1 Tax=Paenibacillus mucilaginosus (strain KNP414) TaxID=1036673 RepID=F8FL28_PAEMK|nr:MFS transporter [Paenibacillus mucilaginosus]AEI39947.1 sugar (glycoside-Pentoside-hexuronide) transporter [Paenibacillus mucilaginosus KNP414]MCG7216373.1 MFS transporter [Paenibacillus mucilaginosus]WDM29207.1 MFS transporter [Paenibacillus mucilaginosus]